MSSAAVLFLLSLPDPVSVRREAFRYEISESIRQHAPPEWLCKQMFEAASRHEEFLKRTLADETCNLPEHRWPEWRAWRDRLRGELRDTRGRRETW